MKTIALTQGKVATVDDADYDWLNQWKWCAHKDRTTWYAMRGACKDGKQTMLRMHREILGLKKGDDIEADHKNGDGLNNRRNNLRIATSTQNHHNQRKRTGLSSQYKGVCWDRCEVRWKAQIMVAGKQLHLGYFLTEVEAARAYDEAAVRYFGPFAKLNFSEVSYAVA